MNVQLRLQKLCFIMALTLAYPVHAQKNDKNKKETIEVRGNCGMCKARIQKAAAKVKGVKYAQWDVVSKELTIIFNENKCSPMDVKKAVARVGHDTDSVLAEDAIYNTLPPCCLFRNPESQHMDHGGAH